MKIATTILVVAVVVCASHVEAASWLDSAKDSVEGLTKSIGDKVNEATVTLQDGLNKAKAQTELATEKLQEAAEKVGDNVKGTVGNVQESVDKQVNELTEQAEAEGVDVSECKQVAKSIREAASTVVNQTVSCIKDTLKNAKDAVTNVVTQARETLKEIQDLRKKAEECSSGNPEGVMARIATTSCLTTVNTKTVWVVSTGVPSVIKNAITTTKLILALPPTLTSCLSKTAIEALNEQSQIVVDDVKQCVAEKTGKKLPQQESPIEEKKSDENKETAAKNPISWFKTKIF